tara:strand:- start:7857 stop:8399 length:543 start_codon:yes stop_codon:yes gene_type:complete
MIDFIKRINSFYEKYFKYILFFVWPIELFIGFFLDESINWFIVGLKWTLFPFFVGSIYLGIFYLISSFFLKLYEKYRDAPPLVIFQLVTTILLILGAFPIEAMWYYSFLRIVVFFAAVTTIVSNYANSKDNDLSMAILLFSVFIAFIFNPFNPVYFEEKAPWVAIDLLSAVFFLFCIVKE